MARRSPGAANPHIARALPRVPALAAAPAGSGAHPEQARGYKALQHDRRARLNYRRQVDPCQVIACEGGGRAKLDLRRHMSLGVAGNLHPVGFQPSPATVGLELMRCHRRVLAPGVLDRRELLDPARLAEDRCLGERNRVEAEHLQLYRIRLGRLDPPAGLPIDAPHRLLVDPSELRGHDGARLARVLVTPQVPW